MSLFNVESVGTKTVNLAGGEAFKENPKLELISILLTSFLQDHFYRGKSETIEKLKDLAKHNYKFAAKAAIYARTRFGMRSVSHVLAGEIAKHVKREVWTKSFLEKVIYRPDDMLEILSYYMGTYGKRPIPNALKKAFRKKLSSLNEYTLAKYRGEGKTLKMVDLVNLLHPKGTPAIEKLMKGELKSTETWESKLTKAGQEAEGEEELKDLKGKAWKELLTPNDKGFRKLGYFALLRNLRNILEQAPECLADACSMLIDPELIKKSLVLPFRYQTAIQEIMKVSGGQMVLSAIAKATDISLSNVPELPGKTLIALDVSGSMQGKPIEIGALFAACLYKTNNAELLMFSDNSQYINLLKTDSIISLSSQLQRAATQGGTDFNTIFNISKAYDRIIILSDMQGWIGHNAPIRAFSGYKARTKCNPIIYSFDLQGYGTLQFPEKNIYCIAGFSEKIFDVMKLLEEDRNALISEVERTEI